MRGKRRRAAFHGLGLVRLYFRAIASPSSVGDLDVSRRAVHCGADTALLAKSTRQLLEVVGRWAVSAGNMHGERPWQRWKLGGEVSLGCRCQ